MSRHEPTRTKIQLRKGDQVKVMAGPDAGRSGRVLSVNPLKNTVIVEHANIVKRHTRANPNKNVKLLDTAAQELGQITGQKPIITRAKKSIANFKIRKGMPIGCAVTLRGDKMYEFLDRLCNVVLPRVRDFRGLPSNAFDGRGNYTLGLKDQLVFPEIDYTRVDKIKGMNITLTTTAKNDEEGRELLLGLGFPLRKPGGAN